MNIQDASRKLLHEPGREQAHVSRQANQIDVVLLQGGYDFAIVLFALLAFGRDDHRSEAELARDLDSAGVGLVGDDDCDVGIGEFFRKPRYLQWLRSSSRVRRGGCLGFSWESIRSSSYEKFGRGE